MKLFHEQTHYSAAGSQVPTCLNSPSYFPIFIWLLLFYIHKIPQVHHVAQHLINYDHHSRLLAGDPEVRSRYSMLSSEGWFSCQQTRSADIQVLYHIIRVCFPIIHDLSKQQITIHTQFYTITLKSEYVILDQIRQVLKVIYINPTQSIKLFPQCMTTHLESCVH